MVPRSLVKPKGIRHNNGSCESIRMPCNGESAPPAKSRSRTACLIIEAGSDPFIKDLKTAEWPSCVVFIPATRNDGTGCQKSGDAYARRAPKSSAYHDGKLATAASTARDNASILSIFYATATAAFFLAYCPATLVSSRVDCNYRCGSRLLD